MNKIILFLSKVLDDGAGILSLWNQQLQQFYGVRHETSVAITQRFPTPKALSKVWFFHHHFLS